MSDPTHTLTVRRDAFSAMLKTVAEQIDLAGPEQAPVLYPLSLAVECEIRGLEFAIGILQERPTEPVPLVTSAETACLLRGELPEVERPAPSPASPEAAAGDEAVSAALQPLLPPDHWLRDPEVEEVCINAPGEETPPAPVITPAIMSAAPDLADAEPRSGKPPTQKERVLDLYLAGTTEVGAIVDATGFNRDSVNAHLSMLRRDGAIPKKRAQVEDAPTPPAEPEGTPAGGQASWGKP